MVCQQPLDAVDARRHRTGRQAGDLGDSSRILALEVEQHDLPIERFQPVQQLVDAGERQPIGHLVFRRRHRDLVARLWTQYLVAGVLPENQAADRERTIRIERETLAERLESGDEFVGYGEPARMIAMRHPDVWRLRFVEYHLARAFGFYGYDARTRWARREIGRTLAPFRPVGR